MKVVLCATVLLTTFACGGWPALLTPGAPASPLPALPTRQQISELVLRADALRVLTLDGALPTSLAETVVGPAAALLRRQATRAQELRERYETVVTERVVVHWSAGPGGSEAVVETAGRQRLVTPGGTTAWDDYADQWAYTLRWSSGWRVWGASDLAPGDWWPA